VRLEPFAVGRRLAANLGAVGRRALAARALPRRLPTWVVVRVGGPLDDAPSPRSVFAREPVQPLLDVLEVLEAAAADPRVDGVLLRFRGSPAGWSKVQSLRRALLGVRERGKPVAVYADGLDAEGLLLATAATKIWLPESGSVFLVGLRAESLFFKGLLERFGVRPEVVRIGGYKSAGELLTRQNMSEEAREQLSSLLDGLFDELVEGIAAGRNLEVEAVRALVDRGPFHGRAAVEAGLTDGCLYPDELEAELIRMTPGGAAATDGEEGAGEVRFITAPAYHALRVCDRGWQPLFSGLPRVAYVVAGGAIHRGSAGRGISAEGYCRLFERLREADAVRGVVLRIDSPGGEGTASDLLWRSASLVAQEKPLIASMGDVAASGGYFLASAAHSIYAEASTMTGSIGVIGGKLNLEGFYDRMGVGKDGVERGARAGLLSDSRGFTPDEKAAVREGMSSFYDLFVDRVARGRRLSVEQVERAGRGRVWSGARAKTLGLVDAIGGPLEALAAVRTLAGLDADDRYLLDRHPRFAPLAGLVPLLRQLPRRIEAVT
jgi:protease-4